MMRWTLALLVPLLLLRFPLSFLGYADLSHRLKYLLIFPYPTPFTRYPDPLKEREIEPFKIRAFKGNNEYDTFLYGDRLDPSRNSHEKNVAIINSMVELVLAKHPKSLSLKTVSSHICLSYPGYKSFVVARDVVISCE